MPIEQPGTPLAHSAREARPAVRRFERREDLIAALAERLVPVLSAPGGAIMLSGGNTPLPAYRAVADRGLKPASDLTLFYSDDRYVPSTSEGSNYHQTLPLLQALALPEERVLRVRTELPLSEAALDYERRLGAIADRGVRITLGLLGLGEDGHTASLFSSADLERATGRLAIAVHRPDGRDAVSVTPAVLARAEEIVFVVAGADKQTALARLLARSADSVAWRAVSAAPSVEVWADASALMD
jgi:6-phosphogluconolactonase